MTAGWRRLKPRKTVQVVMQSSRKMSEAVWGVVEADGGLGKFEADGASQKKLWLLLFFQGTLPRPFSVRMDQGTWLKRRSY